MDVIISILTLIKVDNNSSSPLENNALLRTAATKSGWRFFIAATATRLISALYNKAYQRDWISFTVKRQENLIPR